MKNYTLEELLATPKARKIIEENLSSYNDEDYVYAVMEYAYWHYNVNKKAKIYTFDELENAIQDIEDQKYTIYSDIDSYHDSCDETLEFNSDFIERYFDYDSFHRDCDFDVTETSNWVVICDY